MFWNSPEINKTILIIPNYTFSKDLEKDSFVDVIYQHINSLEGIQWVLPIPRGKGISKLNLPNVKQVECDISGNMIWMRSNLPLDVIKLLKESNYDMVYSHLTDWSIGRYTKKPIIGYSHWWEMKECNGISWLNYSLNLPHELINVLDYKVCYLNTHQQKRMVLDNARDYFNDAIVNRIDTILEVLHLSVDESKIIDKPSDDYDNVIVFNHRTESYKGWDRFIKYMERYREHRTDFKVWAPLLDKPNKWSWVDTTKYPKQQYLELLSKCCVGVQPKQKHGGWSVSGTDCMMRGLPMLFEEQDCFYEIDSNANTYKDYNEFQSKLDKFLDDKTYRMSMSTKGLQGALKLTKNDGIERIKNILLP